MNWDNNFYDSPEKSGLEIVAELEFGELSYSFDTRVVWRHKDTGTLYTARDSGCSCPAPFENYNTLADLDTVGLASIQIFEAEIRDADDWSRPKPEAADVFMAAVRKALQ